MHIIDIIIICIYIKYYLFIHIRYILVCQAIRKWLYRHTFILYKDVAHANHVVYHATIIEYYVCISLWRPNKFNHGRLIKDLSHLNKCIISLNHRSVRHCLKKDMFLISLLKYSYCCPFETSPNINCFWSYYEANSYLRHLVLWHLKY